MMQNYKKSLCPHAHQEVPPSDLATREEAPSIPCPPNHYLLIYLEAEIHCFPFLPQPRDTLIDRQDIRGNAWGRGLSGLKVAVNGRKAYVEVLKAERPNAPAPYSIKSRRHQKSCSYGTLQSPRRAVGQLAVPLQLECVQKWKQYMS